MTDTAAAPKSPDIRPRPRGWRVLLGFVLAPLVPIAGLLLLSGLWTAPDQWRGTLGLFPWVLAIGGYGPAILVGLPTFFILIETAKPTVVNSMLAGTVVATVPWFVVFAVLRPNSSFSNGHVTTENGIITLDGLIDLLWVMIPFGVSGAIGGLVFWVAALSGNGRAPGA